MCLLRRETLWHDRNRRLFFVRKFSSPLVAHFRLRHVTAIGFLSLWQSWISLSTWIERLAFVYNHPQLSLSLSPSTHTTSRFICVVFRFYRIRKRNKEEEEDGEVHYGGCTANSFPFVCVCDWISLPLSLSLIISRRHCFTFLFFFDLFPSSSSSSCVLPFRSFCISRTVRVSTGGLTVSSSTRCWSANRRSMVKMKRNSLPPSRIKMFPIRNRCPKRPRKSAKESVGLLLLFNNKKKKAIDDDGGK